MEIEIGMMGGGLIRLSHDAVNLEEVADILRRERVLIGRPDPADLIDHGINDVGGRVLIPAQRIQLIREV